MKKKENQKSISPFYRALPKEYVCQVSEDVKYKQRSKKLTDDGRWGGSVSHTVTSADCRVSSKAELQKKVGDENCISSSDLYT